MRFSGTKWSMPLVIRFLIIKNLYCALSIEIIFFYVSFLNHNSRAGKQYFWFNNILFRKCPYTVFVTILMQSEHIEISRESAYLITLFFGDTSIVVLLLNPEQNKVYVCTSLEKSSMLFLDSNRTGITAIYILQKIDLSLDSHVQLPIPNKCNPCPCTVPPPCTWYFVVTENVTLFAPSFSFKLSCEKRDKKYKAKWTINSYCPW